MEFLADIRIVAVVHNGERRILMQFSRDDNLESVVPTLPGCRWSSTLRGWYIANNPDNLRLIFRTFKGIATIDKSGVFGNTTIRKEAPSVQPVMSEMKKVNRPGLPENSITKIDQFRVWMQQQRYSQNTIKTYTEAITTFLKYFQNKDLADISNADLIKFNHRYIQELLGHISVKTTERYTHVANKAISKLRNPMDDIFGNST